MNQKTKNNKGRIWFLPIAVCLLAIGGITWYYLFSSLSKEQETVYVCIDDDDNIDSVFTKVKAIAKAHGSSGFQTLARHSSYPDNIRTGRYEVGTGDGALKLFRKMKNGMQTPLNLTIPSVRTMDRLAGFLGDHLMMDSTDIVTAFSDSLFCDSLGYSVATLPALFIPNTYQVYWTTSLSDFVKRMQRENATFWNDQREAKAKALGMTHEEVFTLASIIDEETANNAEKPMIAGMYINRLHTGMPLQADPTIKFALQDFTLRRIWGKHLNVVSPYNTYKNIGLPPGPIRIPSIAGIDAVLDAKKHDYLYMCAKEDFSGTHNFARTYGEHLQNARKYTEALNNRGIK